MRASLRPQKRDHFSAFNTRTNRKVLHLRKCAEALLKELENKKSDESNDSDDDKNNNDFSKRTTKVKFLAAEVALRAIRRAREGDLPRKLIDQQNYCLRCGFPLNKEEDKEEDQKKKSNTNESNNNSENRRMNCSCCGYKLSSSINAKKKKKKTKKRRIL